MESDVKGYSKLQFQEPGKELKNITVVDYYQGHFAKWPLTNFLILAVIYCAVLLDIFIFFSDNLCYIFFIFINFCIFLPIFAFFRPFERESMVIYENGLLIDEYKRKIKKGIKRRFIMYDQIKNLYFQRFTFYLKVLILLKNNEKIITFLHDSDSYNLIRQMVKNQSGKDNFIKFYPNKFHKNMLEKLTILFIIIVIVSFIISVISIFVFMLSDDLILFYSNLSFITLAICNTNLFLMLIVFYIIPRPDSDYPEPFEFRCPKCKFMFEVDDPKRPLKIKCPLCNVEGVIN
jgi:hypothetical protein